MDALRACIRVCCFLFCEDVSNRSPQNNNFPLATSLVYNLFIAPVYTAIGAFASLMLINTALFMASCIFCKIVAHFAGTFHPVLQIFLCAQLCALSMYKMAPKSSRLSLALAVSLASMHSGLASIYLASWLPSPGWAIPIGALLGLNLYLLVDSSPMDELIKANFNKMVVVQKKPK